MEEWGPRVSDSPLQELAVTPPDYSQLLVN